MASWSWADDKSEALHLIAEESAIALAEAATERAEVLDAAAVAAAEDKRRALQA